MNRFIQTAGAALLAAAIALPALAADLSRPGKPVYKAPVFVAPYSWTGFYVGLNGGYGWGTSNFSNAVATGSVKPKGALLGGTIGYNMQTANWVWGLEGDFDASWMRGSDSTSTFCAGGVGCELKNTWFGTARGRIGVAFDRFLPYITGGAAFGDEKLTVPTGVSESKTRVGWTVGGGVEYAFMGPWSVKLEYLYADLGKWSCTTACALSTDVSFKTNIVRGGINYRF